MSPPQKEIQLRKLPRILPTDSYAQCYKKVETFVDYLLKETEGKGIPKGDLRRLQRAKKRLEEAKARPTPFYIKQILERSGHILAGKLLAQLEEITENYVKLQTKANTLARNAMVASQLVHTLVEEQEAYVFDNPDDVDRNPDLVFTSGGQISPANIISVDLSQIHCGGGFGTVYIGQGERYGKVAVKRLSRQVTSSKTLSLLHIQQFRREAAVWAQLRHENILPLLGVCVLESTLHMVSPFMTNGNVREYVTLNPGANRIALLREIASGLKYMHDINIIHGDVKGPNILVSDTEHALLCDFGLTRLISEDTTMGRKGSKAWMSPEQWNDGKTSFATDVYALGITISEVLSGNQPFPGLSGEQLEYCVVVKKRRPIMEPAVSPSGESYRPIWALAEQCWQEDPKDRPSVADVVAYLSRPPVEEKDTNVWATKCY